MSPAPHACHRLLPRTWLAGLGLLPAALALCMAVGASASDGVPTSGILSDSDFYRLAACGAPPGGACRSQLLWWRSSKVTLALLPAEPGFPRAKSAALERAIDGAIAQINGAGAGISLRRSDAAGNQADIVITPTELAEGEPARAIPGIPDGARLGVGYMNIRFDANGWITRGGIAIARDIDKADLPSVVLEEIFQSLGFLYDVENPAYEGVSILAQDSNVTRRISGQDLMLLLTHYPR